MEANDGPASKNNGEKFAEVRRNLRAARQRSGFFGDQHRTELRTTASSVCAALGRGTGGLAFAFGDGVWAWQER